MRDGKLWALILGGFGPPFPKRFLNLGNDRSQLGKLGLMEVTSE